MIVSLRAGSSWISLKFWKRRQTCKEDQATEFDRDRGRDGDRVKDRQSQGHSQSQSQV